MSAPTEAPAVDYSPEQVEILRKTIGKEAGLNDDEFDLFLEVAKRTRLDPFTRQIYPQKRKSNRGPDKMNVQTSIDGARVVADRTGRYEGQVGPFWCGPDGEWRDVWISKDFPAAAKVGIYRAGAREPIWAPANWSEYVQTNNDGKPAFMWARMPSLMLAKCAEALALRKAFPNDLSGVYVAEELDQADSVTPVEETVPQPRPRANPKTKPPAGAHEQAESKPSDDGEPTDLDAPAEDGPAGGEPPEPEETAPEGEPPADTPPADPPSDLTEEVRRLQEALGWKLGTILKFAREHVGPHVVTAHWSALSDEDAGKLLAALRKEAGE